MLKKLLMSSALMCLLAAAGLAQNTTTRPTRRPSTPATGTSTTTQQATTTTTTTQEATDAATPSTTTTGARTRRAGTSSQTGRATSSTTTTTTTTTTAKAAIGTPRAAFDDLIDGIKRGDVDAVMGVYWNSPRLVTFNNNGTITKTWAQNRSNRESLYADVKDVQLEVRDVNVELLGRDGAVVTCLWKQTQPFRGTPETATGRLTVVFRRVGNTWKAVHTHTSPDRPDPSLLLQSERTVTTTTTTTPAPTRP